MALPGERLQATVGVVPDGGVTGGVVVDGGTAGGTGGVGGVLVLIGGVEVDADGAET